MLLNTFVSSAYMLRELSLQIPAISEEKHKNNKGPNTVPCGTPDITFYKSENSLPTLTHCFLSTKKFFIHNNAEPFKPYLDSLNNNLLCIKAFRII